MKYSLWWLGYGQSTTGEKYCLNCGWKSPFKTWQPEGEDKQVQWLPPFCPKCGSRNKVTDASTPTAALVEMKGWILKNELGENSPWEE